MRRGGRERGALTGEREDAGLGEPAELLEDAAALGDADGEGHVLPARARRRHGRGARAPQLGVVRARLRHDASSSPPPARAPSPRLAADLGRWGRVTRWWGGVQVGGGRDGVVSGRGKGRD